MIDVNEIKTGDCLMISKGGGNFKVCFVLFPDIKNNVCIRHEYEIALQHIRIKRYVEDVPSDLKDYMYIPVVDFKEISFCINDATQKCLDLLKKRIQNSTPISDILQCQLYRLITGEYLIEPSRGYYEQCDFTITVSPNELAKSVSPPQDWQTGGAERFIIDKFTYVRVFFIYSDTILSLVRKLVGIQIKKHRN